MQKLNIYTKEMVSRKMSTRDMYRWERKTEAKEVRAMQRIRQIWRISQRKELGDDLVGIQDGLASPRTYKSHHAI